MTTFLKQIISFFNPVRTIPQNKSILDISSRDRKKIIRKAVQKSNKMQQAVLDDYKKNFPNKPSQYYVSN